jgi:hypothetical protein
MTLVEGDPTWSGYQGNGEHIEPHGRSDAL